MIEGKIEFVIAAYLITIFVLGGLVLFVLIDRARIKKALKKLEGETANELKTSHE